MFEQGYILLKEHLENLSILAPERSKTEKGSEGPGFALSAGAHTAILLEGEDSKFIVCKN
jgi:hypothetical protein